MIGSLGPVPFVVSSKKMQTFETLTRDNSSRIATHENLQNKPILEFIGPGLDSVQLSLTWSIEHGINPDVEVKKLRDLRDKGEIIPFILGSKPYGSGNYMIENISEESKRIDNRGNTLSITFSISLIEYVKNLKKVNKITPKPKMVPQKKKNTKKKVVKKKKNTTKSIPKKNTKKKVISNEKYDLLSKYQETNDIVKKLKNPSRK